MQTDPSQALLGFPISRAPRAHLHAPRWLCHRQIPGQGDPRGVPALESLASAAGEQIHPVHSSVLLLDAPTPQVLPNLGHVSTPAVPFQPGRLILAKTHREASCDPSSQTCESLVDECVYNSTRNPVGLGNKIKR